MNGLPQLTAYLAVSWGTAAVVWGNRVCTQQHEWVGGLGLLGSSHPAGLQSERPVPYPCGRPPPFPLWAVWRLPLRYYGVALEAVVTVILSVPSLHWALHEITYLKREILCLRWLPNVIRTPV